jgi:GTP cyclohydrolase IA
VKKPTKQQAEAAVQLLLNYIVGDTNKESLKDTPARVVKSYFELFAGYDCEIESILDKRFRDISEYNYVVLLRSVNFTSTCEHHMLPFSGTVDIAYIPNGEVIGISKLARLIDAFARRLQIQERMTAEIACALQEHLQPKGVAIRVSATHSCMSNRGVLKLGSVMESTHFTGEYENDLKKRQEFLSSVRRL